MAQGSWLTVGSGALMTKDLLTCVHFLTQSDHSPPSYVVTHCGPEDGQWPEAPGGSWWGWFSRRAVLELVGLAEGSIPAQAMALRCLQTACDHASRKVASGGLSGGAPVCLKSHAVG